MPLSKERSSSLRRDGAGKKIVMVGILLFVAIPALRRCDVTTMTFDFGALSTDVVRSAIGRVGADPPIVDRRDRTFTDYGWFHPDPDIVISTGRYKSSSVYVNASCRTRGATLPLGPCCRAIPIPIVRSWRSSTSRLAAKHAGQSCAATRRASTDE